MTNVVQTPRPLTRDEAAQVGGGTVHPRPGFGFGVEREMKESGELAIQPLNHADMLLAGGGTLPGLHKSSNVTLKRGLIG